MSELTLFLIRLAYLAILWIFVLSAISVIRSDMFGARVPEAPARPRPAGQGTEGPQGAHQAPRRPTHVLVVEGSNAGERADLDQAPILIGRGPDAAIRLDDDYVSTRHARIAASGDQWFVEDLGSTNGTYVGTRPDHPAHDAHPRHPGPDRQDDPRAEEVEAAAPMTFRLQYAAISDVGRVRKDNQDSGYAGPWLLAVCDGVGGAARGDIASSTASSSCAGSTRSPPTTCSARSPAPCTARTTGSASWSTRTPRSTAPAPPPPSPSSTARGSASATSATAAPTSSATARSPSSPRTTRSCRPSSTRAGSPRRRRGSTRTAT